jgi:hypothetical protein
MMPMSSSIVRSNERAHSAGIDDWWAESWSFTFAVPDLTDVGWLGGFAHFTHLPRQRKAWFCTGIVAQDRPYVLCRDHDLSAPVDPNTFEVRGGGLWSHAICETPGEHWTVAMEAFALSFDDPQDAWGSEMGDRVGLAFDLEWEGSAKDFVHEPSAENEGRYDTHCEVNGVVQLGDDEWDIVAVGARSHQWGMIGGAASTGWRADPLVDAARPISNRTTLAVAPFKTDLPNGTTGRIRRTLDRLTHPTGDPTLQWTEALLS